MEEMMEKMIEHQIKACETWGMVQHSNQIMDYYEPCECPSSHAFRIPVRQGVIKNYHLPFSEVSISHPMDTDIDKYEIALIKDDEIVYIDRLGMSDIYRFFSFDELVDGLTRLAKNQQVDDDFEERDDDGFSE
jgi:hypothetical protein